MLIRELYLDSIHYDESVLAHFIYHLLKEKKIALDDDISKLDLYEADTQLVAKMIDDNILGIHPVRIYSLKMSRETFVFIFARIEQAAIQFFMQKFRQAPLNCQEYPLGVPFTRGNDLISFRDMRKEMRCFPAIAGYFRKMD
ncbi:hypothetical protein [Pseudoneobacillus sp. C159]